MLNAHKVTTRGIVLGNRAVGEGNLRTDFYTEKFGLVSALSRSGREERSQLRAHLQEGTAGLYSFVLGKNTWHVTGAFQTENIYFSAPNTSDPTSRVIGIVRQLVHGEAGDESFFSSLWQFFNTLPTLSEEEARDAECLVVLRILSGLGYVADSQSMRDFVHSGYDAAVLHEARQARRSLVQTINEGIAASGL